MAETDQSHRCSELLKYNENPDHLPLFIRRKNKGYPYAQRYEKVWKLGHIDIDIERAREFPEDVCEIRFCPLCGKDLREGTNNV